MSDSKRIFRAILDEFTPNTPEHKRVSLFSEITGIRNTIIHQYLRGDRNIGNKAKASLISKGVNPLFIETGKGSILQTKEQFFSLPKNIMRLPVYTNIPCGSPAVIFQDGPLEYMTVDKIKGLKNPVILQAKGDSNLPIIRDKDLVIAHEITKPKKGDLVATNFRGADPGTLNANIKIFQPVDKDTFLLKPINTTFDTTIHQYVEVYNFYKCIRLMRDLY